MVRGIILTALSIQVSGSSSTLKVIGELLNSQDEYMALASLILSLTLICRALKLLIPDACLPAPSSTSTQQKAPNVDLTVSESSKIFWGMLVLLIGGKATDGK